MTTSLLVVNNAVHLRQELDRREGKVGLVMTMGALHEGHLSLVRQIAEQVDTVVVSIFVNPTQFGPGEDFSSYPRDLDADVKALSETPADIIYAPTVDEVYPSTPQVRIDPGPLATILEGETRPGHFAGVCLIVAKIFGLVGPQVAIFGQKDAQQLAVIRQMVTDLQFPIKIIGAPIVREEDGLALSSRNAYLSSSQRQTALGLSLALAEGKRLANEGARAQTIIKAVAEKLAASGGIETDYVALATEKGFNLVSFLRLGGESGHASTAEPTLNAPVADFKAYLLVAAKVGRTRLIDNVLVEVKNHG